VEKGTPTDLETLLLRIEELEKRLVRLEAENTLLKAELARKGKIIAGLQQRLFGSSSEKLDPAQLQLEMDEILLGTQIHAVESIPTILRRRRMQTAWTQRSEVKARASSGNKRRNIRTGGGKTKRPEKPPHQSRALPEEPDDPHREGNHPR
jgi:hypothetical protein